MMALRDQQNLNSIIESLTMLDISPVAYDARAFSEVSGTLDILRTVDDAAKVQSRESVLQLLAALLPDDSLRLFVQSNMIWNDRQLRWNFNLDVLRNNVVHVAGFSCPWGDAAGRLRTSEYQGPALVLKGENSHFVQPEHHSETTAHFPNVQVRSIGGAGHWLHIDRPQESAQAVAEFIRSVAAGSTAVDAGVDNTSAQSWLASAASRAEGLVSAV
jgi:pimeloyl-ACP methyl ester carboxylesterase